MIILTCHIYRQPVCIVSARTPLTVTLYLVLHIIGPIYMLMANYDNIHSPSFRIYFHRLNEFVFAKKMMQYNRARERGVGCMQWRSYYGANGASAPPGLFWDVLLGRKCAKIHLQQSRISKNFGGNTPGPPL